MKKSPNLKKEQPPLSESQSNIVKPETNRISEFFNHLIAYGGINIVDGVITYWGDYSTFIPLEAFAYLFHELERRLGADQAHDIFYWLGRLTGKNATQILIKKFGLDKSNIPEFVNGATQDGMGYLKITQYDSKNLTSGEVVGTNSIFALKYSSLFGQKKGVIDFYLSGILAGGAEPLFNISIGVEELDCMVSGSEKCIYSFKRLQNKPHFKFFDALDLDEDQIIKRTDMLSLKRKTQFKIFGKKDIKFGDGSFTLRGIQGVNLMNYAQVVLDKIIFLKLKKVKKEIDISLAREYLGPLKEKITSRELRDILKELEIFGYGKFDIKIAGTKKVIISNPNNPYPEDYMQIFGRSKEPVDNFVCLLIKEALRINNRKAEVKELNCRAKGDKDCIFEISFL